MIKKILNTILKNDLIHNNQGKECVIENAAIQMTNKKVNKVLA